MTAQAASSAHAASMVRLRPSLAQCSLPEVIFLSNEEEFPIKSFLQDCNLVLLGFVAHPPAPFASSLLTFHNPGSLQEKLGVVVKKQLSSLLLP